jgi:hypothetical protein
VERWGFGKFWAACWETNIPPFGSLTVKEILDLSTFLENQEKEKHGP